MLSVNCFEIYNPQRDISIDKATITPYFDEANKTVKRRFRIWIHANSIMGYVCELDVYIRKKGDKPEVGLGGNVVQ